MLYRPVNRQETAAGTAETASIGPLGGWAAHASQPSPEEMGTVTVVTSTPDLTGGCTPWPFWPALGAERMLLWLGGAFRKRVLAASWEEAQWVLTAEGLGRELTAPAPKI